ncbi:MAG: J domain-containing protein [Syntrophales bacterium]|nr:J domain-containing protein [Syntrophales bacterium]
MAENITTERLLEACRLLFGNHVDLSPDFLLYLKESGLKSAYRQRARETHPDRAAILNCDLRYLENQFKLINDAYHYLLAYIKNPHRLITFNSSPRQRATNVKPRRYEFQESTQIKMPFGRYLFYRGLITYRELIEALLWQRARRPTIGELAKRTRLLTEGEIREILKKRKWGERFGESAHRLGYLTLYDIDRLLARQRLIQPRIGRYFVEKGILSSSEIERLAWELRQLNYRRARTGRGTVYYP